MPTDFGRLLVVGIRGAAPGEHLLEADLQACREAGVGGIILFDVDVPALSRLPHADPLAAPRNIRSPEQLAALVEYVRDQLGPDLWISVDQEGGQVARLSPRRGFAADPSAEEFAALATPLRIEAARAQADRLASLGINLNFAPCVDLRLNPESEILARNGRVYSDRPGIVIEAANTVLDAHAAAGVAACLKHFPGHGSSAADTHEGVADITGTWQREVELAPYIELGTRPGLCVMVAHVQHQDLDPSLPASLSPRIIDGLLRSEIGFDGVVVTDSIDMLAIARRWSPTEAAVAAVQAGADLVVDGFNLTPRDEHPATAMASALEERISPERLRRSLDRLDRLRSDLGGLA